jgi:hypothetical protein
VRPDWHAGKAAVVEANGDGIAAIAAALAPGGVQDVWLIDPHPDPAWWDHPAVRFAPPPAIPGDAPTMASVAAGERTVFVCDAAREVRWPFAGQPAAAIVRTILRIETALDQPLRWSPATVGLRLIRDTFGYRRKDDAGSRLRWRDGAAPAELPAITACALHWSRPLTVDEAARDWWHFYDLNAAYVAAMQSTPVGVLAPVKAWWEPVDAAGKRAGLWQITVSGANPVIRFSGWYDTAIVRAALAADAASVQIGAGWVWTTSVYALRVAADRLWAARVACQEAGDAAGVAAVKAIYTQAFGSLNSPRRGDQPSDYYRPHWYEAIRGESTRRTWAAVQQYDAFCANVDMIGIVSDREQPDDVHADLAARRAKLGGYKPALSVRPSAALRRAAAAGALSASQLVKAAREEAKQ